VKTCKKKHITHLLSAIELRLCIILEISKTTHSTQFEFQSVNYLAAYVLVYIVIYIVFLIALQNDGGNDHSGIYVSYLAKQKRTYVQIYSWYIVML